MHLLFFISNDTHSMVGHLGRVWKAYSDGPDGMDIGQHPRSRRAPSWIHHAQRARAQNRPQTQFPRLPAQRWMGPFVCLSRQRGAKWTLPTHQRGYQGSKRCQNADYIATGQDVCDTSSSSCGCVDDLELGLGMDAWLS